MFSYPCTIWLMDIYCLRFWFFANYDTARYFYSPAGSREAEFWEENITRFFLLQNIVPLDRPLILMLIDWLPPQRKFTVELDDRGMAQKCVSIVLLRIIVPFGRAGHSHNRISHAKPSQLHTLYIAQFLLTPSQINCLRDAQLNLQTYSCEVADKTYRPNPLMQRRCLFWTIKGLDLLGKTDLQIVASCQDCSLHISFTAS